MVGAHRNIQLTFSCTVSSLGRLFSSDKSLQGLKEPFGLIS
jgi:hypothetical protein